MTKQLTIEQKQIQDGLELKLQSAKDNRKVCGQMLMLLGQLQTSQSFNRNQFRSQIKRFLNNAKEVLELQNNKQTYNSIYNAMQLIKNADDCYNVLVPTLAKFLGHYRAMQDDNLEKQQPQQDDGKPTDEIIALNQINDQQQPTELQKIDNKESPVINENTTPKGITFDDLVSNKDIIQAVQDDQPTDQIEQAINENLSKNQSNKQQKESIINPYSILNQSQLNKQSLTMTKDVQTDEREPLPNYDDPFKVKVEASMQHTTLPYQIDTTKRLSKIQMEQLQKDFLEKYNEKLQLSISRRVQQCIRLREVQIYKAKQIISYLENLKGQINGQLVYKVVGTDLKVFNQPLLESINESALNVNCLTIQESDLQSVFKRMLLTQQMYEFIPAQNQFFSDIYIKLIQKKYLLLQKLKIAQPMQKYIKLKQLVQTKQVDLLVVTKRLVNIKQVCSQFLVRVAVKQLLQVKKSQTISMLIMCKYKLDMTTRVKKDLLLSLCKLKLKQLIIERRRLNNIILRSKKLAMPKLPIIQKNITLITTHMSFYIDQIHIIRTKMAKMESKRAELLQLKISIANRKKFKIKQRIFMLMMKQKMFLYYQYVIQLKGRFNAIQSSKQ